MFIRDKIVKTNKVQRCWGCAVLFPAGTLLRYVVSKFDGSLSDCYWCNCCEKVMSTMDRSDLEDGIDLGDIHENAEAGSYPLVFMRGRDYW